MPVFSSSNLGDRRAGPAGAFFTFLRGTPRCDAAARLPPGVPPANPPPSPSDCMNASLRAMRPRRSRSYWLRPSSPVEGRMASACAAAAAALARCTGSAARARAPLDRSMPAAPGRAVGDSETRGGFLLLAAAVLADARLENSSPSGATYVQRPPLLRDAVQPDGRPLLWAAAAASIAAVTLAKVFQRRMIEESPSFTCSGAS